RSCAIYTEKAKEGKGLKTLRPFKLSNVRVDAAARIKATFAALPMHRDCERHSRRSRPMICWVDARSDRANLNKESMRMSASTSRVAATEFSPGSGVPARASRVGCLCEHSERNPGIMCPLEFQRRL